MPRNPFDLLAPFYDRTIGEFRDRDLLSGLAGLNPATRLLDTGGGTGRVARELRGLVGALVLADLSLPMLRKARAKELLCACSLSEQLPFADASFDCVLMVDALHHVSDQSATAGELWRVTRPGGCVAIQEPDVRHWLARGVRLFEKLARMGSRFLYPDEIAGLFALPGARVEIMARGFSAWVMIYKEKTG